MTAVSTGKMTALQNLVVRGGGGVLVRQVKKLCICSKKVKNAGNSRKNRKVRVVIKYLKGKHTEDV
jgi:hypothetical protein